MKMKKVKTRIPIYDRGLIIIITKDVNSALFDVAPEEYDEDESESEATVVNDKKGRMNLIIVPDANINTICHESFHIALTTLEDAGMELTHSSEEAYAYLVGWVAEEIQNILTKN